MLETGVPELQKWRSYLLARVEVLLCPSVKSLLNSVLASESGICFAMQILFIRHVVGIRAFVLQAWTGGNRDLIRYFRGVSTTTHV